MHVSVVIPCKNAERWLKDSLISIQQQSHVNLEAILVDDGSTDQSCALAQQIWGDCRWPLRILHTPGIGVSAARNQGWRAARHPLVAFLDADDLMLPGRLSAQATLLSRKPQLGHCLCGWVRINARGESRQASLPWQEGAGFGLEQALRHKAVLPSAWMLRRSVLESSGGFDPALSQAEDVDLLLRLAAAGVRGDWVEAILCGYRVHAAGASRKARAQAQGLSFVVERHLRQLNRSPEQLALAAEVRYGTRAWLGWNAWHCGEPQLASELWTSALGLSPLPPALTWVHLAENVVRSAERIGEQAGLAALLASPTWQTLQRHWWQRRRRPLDTTPVAAAAPLEDDLAWGEILQGRVENGLNGWAAQLQAAIQPQHLQGPGQVCWHPAAMASWAVQASAIGPLQQRVLCWCEQLLKTCHAQLPPAPAASPEAWNTLRAELAQILMAWAAITWPEDRRPTLQRLEQAMAVWASPMGLEALARLQQPSSAAGAAALRQLAAAHPAQPMKTLPLPAQPAFWEQLHTPPDLCSGPQCQPCINRHLHLQGWTTTPDQHGLSWWQAPAQPANPALEPSRPVRLIPMGQAWLRPPLDNPWGSTHGYSVADGTGEILTDLSRRYPQPWSGSCPHAAGAPEPRPNGQPKRIHATVIALVGLSAETYYHWLLEVLPGLRLMGQALRSINWSEVLVWHNGGQAGYVRETLLHLGGLRPDQLIDAQQVPWIQADHLIAVEPPRFAHPSPADQQWLRQLIDPTPQPRAARRVLWLWRGNRGRRPVFGEAETLAELADLNIAVADPARLSVREQAAAVGGSSLVIAAHGGCLSNLVFASAGTHVLELHNPAYHPPYFHSLIAARQLRWASQPQGQRPPALYRDLLFESPATEPILLEPRTVAQAVRLMVEHLNS